MVFQVQRYRENRVDAAVDRMFHNSCRRGEDARGHQLMEHINRSKNNRNIELPGGHQGLNTNRRQSVKKNGVYPMISQKPICLQTGCDGTRDSGKNRQPDHSRPPYGDRSFWVSAMDLLAYSCFQASALAAAPIRRAAPTVVVVDDCDGVSQCGQDFGKNLKLVDDLFKVIDFVDDQKIHCREESTIIPGAAIRIVSP